MEVKISSFNLETTKYRLIDSNRKILLLLNRKSETLRRCTTRENNSLEMGNSKMSTPIGRVRPLRHLEMFWLPNIVFNWLRQREMNLNVKVMKRWNFKSNYIKAVKDEWKKNQVDGCWCFGAREKTCRQYRCCSGRRVYSVRYRLSWRCWRGAVLFHVRGATW